MPPEGGVHEKPNDKSAKMCQRYVGSAIWRRFVKNKSGKSYRGKLQGVATTPLVYTGVYGLIYRLSYIAGRPGWPGPPQYFRQVGAYEGGNAILKRCVLSLERKVGKEFEFRVSGGSEFQSRGPMTEKALCQVMI